MRGFGRRNTANKWARFALKCGLLLTDTKMWRSIADQLRDRADDMGDEVKRRYDDTTERLQDARDALQGRSRWLAPTMNFLGGIGVGMGLGILFAPGPGEETRAVLRDKVVDIKNKVGDIAAGTTGSRSRTATTPATGTEGY